MWRRVKEVWRQAQEQAATKYATQTATSAESAAYLEEVFAAFPFTEEAKDWLRRSVRFEAQDLRSTRGGGYWDPGRNLVFLYTAQYEAAIHELAHAWWHTRRIGQEEAMMQATIQLAQEQDARYARTQGLAYGYIHGIPEQHCSETQYHDETPLMKGASPAARPSKPYAMVKRSN